MNVIDLPEVVREANDPVLDGSLGGFVAGVLFSLGTSVVVWELVGGSVTVGFREDGATSFFEGEELESVQIGDKNGLILNNSYDLPN